MPDTKKDFRPEGRKSPAVFCHVKEGERGRYFFITISNGSYDKVAQKWVDKPFIYPEQAEVISSLLLEAVKWGKEQLEAPAEPEPDSNSPWDMPKPPGWDDDDIPF